MALAQVHTLAFERFKAAYPHRPNNPWPPARELFVRRIREGVDPETMIRAAGFYAADCRTAHLDPKYIPYARTWLSQRRYEDFQEAPASAAPEPNPEPFHRLDWLKDEIGVAAWRSWIEPLATEHASDGALLAVIARTPFALTEVRRRFGARLDPQGTVAWSVAPTDLGQFSNRKRINQ